MAYKTFKELVNDNPDAVKNSSGDYLERPDDGWIITTDGFIGIGYHGNEGGLFKEKWVRTDGGQGHIPTNGYG